MEDFDYSRDISPMKGEFFSTRNLGSTSQEGRESLELMELSGLKKQLELENQIYNMRALREKSDIEFKRARMNLDEDRRKIKNQLELDEILPKIQPLLNNLINDPNVDAATGTIEAEKLRLQLSPITTKNPALNGVIDNTVNALKLKGADQQLIRQAALKAAGDGDMKATQDIMGSRTASDAFSRLAQSQQEFYTKKSEAERNKLQREQAKEIETYQTKSQFDSLNNQLNTILGMKPQSGAQISQSDGEFGASSTGNTAPTYTPQQKKTLEIMIKRMNPSLRKKDMSNESFDKLYNDALEGTYNEIDELIGGVATESNISKKSQ